MARGSRMPGGGATSRSPYEQIRNGILDGTFPSGTQLVEVGIAERHFTRAREIRLALWGDSWARWEAPR